jgi:hypothetical protein
MSFEAEFLEFMPHLVTIYPVAAALTRNGAHTHTVTGVQYHARISGKVVSLRRQDHEDVSGILDVWLGSRVDELPQTTTPISVLDKIELPNSTEWFDRYPMIFAVGRYADPDGIHHTKVQCGWMYHRQGQ